MLTSYEDKQAWQKSVEAHRAALEAAGLAHGQARQELERVHAAIYAELHAARAARRPGQIAVDAAREPWAGQTLVFLDSYKGVHRQALQAAQAAERATHAEVQRLEKRTAWVLDRAVMAGAVAPGR